MDAIDAAVKEFLETAPASNLWIAYSGGMDSHVLLHAISRHADNDIKSRLRAVHINHQLQSEADAWEAHCEQQCHLLDIAFYSRVVDASPQHRESPEQAARRARYNAIWSLFESDDVLLTAHHQRDQAETFLLQLMRGAGIAGLSSMKVRSDTLGKSHHRPLLNIEYETLQAYAKHWCLSWVEDPSNQNNDIRRNFIRNRVLPVLSEQWPQSKALIATSASQLEDTQKALDDFLAQALAAVLVDSDILNLDALSRYSDAQQWHIIRHWFTHLGLPRPGSNQRGVIFEQIIDARLDASAILRWNKAQLFRHNNYLIMLPNWKASDFEQTLTHGIQDIQTDEFRLRLNLTKLDSKDAVLLRYGDYRVRVPQGDKHPKLKALFKSAAVPALLRQSMPQLWYRNEIALIPGIYTTPIAKQWDYNFDFNRLGKAREPLLQQVSVLE